MYVDPNRIKCTNCFKPTIRRLANFKANDEYECYGENYIKCFWELCDYQRSSENFIPKTSENAQGYFTTMNYFIEDISISNSMYTVD